MKSEKGNKRDTFTRFSFQEHKFHERMELNFLSILTIMHLGKISLSFPVLNEAMYTKVRCFEEFSGDWFLQSISFYSFRPIL